MNDSPYSLLKALTEVEAAFKNNEDSITLRNIQSACATRVTELCSESVTFTHFIDHNKNQPCATFIFANAK